MKVAFVTGGSGFLGRSLIAYLVDHGVAVRALARSAAAIEVVRSRGAEPVSGELSDGPALMPRLRGSDVVFHAAAFAEDWGDERVAWEANVTGTERLLAAAREAGVPRFVHVGTEAVLVGGGLLHDVVETRPIPDHPIGIYPRTKAEAERRVLAANGPDFATVVVRPRFIWGADDTSLLPRLVEAATSGKLRWIGGGGHPTSTCHVRNVCEGMLAAAERGRPGEVYFLTDGPPVPFRKMVEDLLETQGIAAPTGTIPRWAAHALAILGEFVWRTFRLRGRPPLTRTAFHLIGEEVTVRDDKARREIGYVGMITRDEGLRELRDAKRREATARG